VFLLSIADNGKGIDMFKQLRGNGLINMQRRAEQIGGSFELKNLQGTRVSLFLPLHYLR
jgi:signal transduction histidine kinase